MGSTAEKLNKLFEEIFALFALGMVNQSTTLQLILLILNALVPLAVLIDFLLAGNLFVSFDALSKFTDIVELFGPLSVHISIMLNFFFSRKIYSQIQALRSELNRRLRECDGEIYEKIERERTWGFVLKFLFIEGVGIGIEGFQLVSLMKSDPNWQASIRTRVISLNINRLMMVQFIYLCDFTTSRMKLLNALRLKILTRDDSSVEKIAVNVRSVKTLDLDIARLIRLTRDYFKWMLLLTITLDVLTIIIDIYWIYGGFIFSDNPNFVQSLCCPWSKIVNIIFLFYSCNGIQRQRDNSLSEIFEWKTDSNAIASSKRRLLLQHFHTSKFTVDANGFFYINYGALIGIVEAITIYMVYFFQFMSDSNIFILAIERLEGDKMNEPLNQAIF